VGDLDRTLDLARALVETPSPNLPGDERAVADLLTDALSERGLPSPQVVAKEPERPNLLVTIDFGPGGRHLCLCGHMDTKPVGSARWSTEPFEAVVEDGRLYGLGSCDMKGALAAMIEAAASADGTPRGRLSLLFTADEERGSVLGAHFLAESQALAADAVVIGEPAGIDADWDRLHLVSRGIASFSIRVRGDQGHSSLSDCKRMTNASLNMARLLIAMEEGFCPRHPVHPLSPSGPTVNPGVMVGGGVNFGVYPGEASFSTDVRTLPGMNRQEFEADLDRWLQEARRAVPDLRAEVGFEPGARGWLPATEVPEDAPIAVATRGALEEVFGRAPPASVFPGATDAAWLQGVAGIPTLPAVGPGLLEHAHSADESVSLAALGACTEVYAALIRRFCA
jgi:acetylornithine deacetylase/succinyl-diaminopimelate desuccinylase-like protein